MVLHKLKSKSLWVIEYPLFPVGRVRVLFPELVAPDHPVITLPSPAPLQHEAFSRNAAALRGS